VIPSLAASTSRPGKPEWQTVSTPETKTVVVASTRSASGPIAESRELSWHDLAGESAGEQVKTVLAAIGVLAMILQALRWLSRAEAA
jgi:hypothetical protein